MRTHNLQERITERGAKLTREMRDAVRERDAEKKQEVLGEIQDFNRKNPEKAVTASRIAGSIRTFDRNRALAAAGILGDRKLSGRTKQDWAVR